MEAPSIDRTRLEALTRENDAYLEISKKIASDISSKALSIQDAVDQMGCLLLSPEHQKRDLGVLLLSDILHNLPSACLSPEQAAVLAAFLSEKLKDHHQVATSALKGVLALVGLPNLPPDGTVQLLTIIFNHISCQQQLQLDRYVIFQIYHSALTVHTKEVQSMGLDFVYGVISSIEGERDPKNLMYLFQWLQAFLQVVDLQHLTEEMFDVLSCYFPVDFKAPPTSPTLITREALAMGLCRCLTSISAFGPFSIPLALEKLDSALKIAKVDALHLLKFGCLSYESEVYYQNSIEIWAQLQKEIFASPDAQLRSQCLDTLTHVMGKLSEGDRKNFENTVLDIVGTLRGNLLPDSRLFHQSSSILLSIAKASDLSGRLVAERVGPLIENTLKITPDPQQKATLLHTLMEFFQANGADSLRDCCSSLCAQAILSSNPHLAVEGFQGFASLAGVVSDEARQGFLLSLHQAVVAPLPAALKLAIHNSLHKIAEAFPNEVKLRVLRNETLTGSGLEAYLAALAEMVDLENFQASVMETFIKYSIQDLDGSAAALRQLSDLLGKHPETVAVLVEKDFLGQLVSFLKGLEALRALPEGFLRALNQTLQLIARHQPADWQSANYKAASGSRFLNENLQVSTLTGLVIPMTISVVQDHLHPMDLLLNAALNSPEEFVRDISLKALASLLNKLKEEDLNGNLATIRQRCEGNGKISLATWVTKGLVTRNHPTGWQWTDLLLDCLADDSQVGRGLRTVLDESQRVLSKENHCQIMPLYRQKFFIHCMNRLNREQTPTEAHLSAVGLLMENTPKMAIVNHFPKIFRLVLLCLEKSPDPEALVVILQTITDFVKGGEAIIEDRLEDILVRVLDLTVFQSSMVVRLCAITCIHQMTKTYKTYQLLPFKGRVVEQLGICVDDRKRLVRRKAMECRALWFLLDAPL
ncbi:MMS19 nucleotide excision repair protein homolog [Dendroctonus ponderosae]|uniref:MMS19 nucleotide excision repair protein homolog n=1 Tax=Dendroctonus ponderosae TaxID=77166 RepID=UPI002034B636|nr:MMS19 nucleotide excision repair protein homolog [Dendroctonus ponderosae]KAH1028912.1 hypothetical protein HUJ05_002231 [Dendroctonus ponderosae]